MIKKGFDEVLYFFLKTVFFLFSILPVWFSDKIAAILGRVWYLLDKRHRELALHNLKQAFSDEMSDEEIRRLVRLNFKNTLKIIFEMAKGYRWSVDELPKYFSLRGEDSLRDAHAKGKGVLLLTGHVGNWEMSVHLKRLVGIDGCGVYRRLDSTLLNRFVLEKRTTGGCRLYPVKDAVMGLFHELGQGNFIGILGDQNTRRSQGVFVDFFGRKACTNKGLAQFALATEAPVVPMFIVRDRNRFLIEFGEEIPLVKTGDKERDIVINTQNYTAAIEEVVRRYPDQWLWVHNRWKTRPLAS